jgi:hypothetical protein
MLGTGVAPCCLDVGERHGAYIELVTATGDFGGECGQFSENISRRHRSLTASGSRSARSQPGPRDNESAWAGGYCRRSKAFHVLFDRRDRVYRCQVLALAVLTELRPAGPVGPTQLVPDVADLA